MGKKKTVTEKIKDAVENVLHPQDHSAPQADQKPQDSPAIDQEQVKKVKAEMAKPSKAKSSSQESELASHPKFAKFKTGEQQP